MYPQHISYSYPRKQWTSDQLRVDIDPTISWRIWCIIAINQRIVSPRHDVNLYNLRLVMEDYIYIYVLQILAFNCGFRQQMTFLKFCAMTLISITYRHQCAVCLCILNSLPMYNFPFHIIFAKWIMILWNNLQTTLKTHMLHTYHMYCVYDILYHVLNAAYEVL